MNGLKRVYLRIKDFNIIFTSFSLASVFYDTQKVQIVRVLCVL
jgi:hypothetical protein